MGDLKFVYKILISDFLCDIIHLRRKIEYICTFRGNMVKVYSFILAYTLKCLYSIILRRGKGMRFSCVPLAGTRFLLEL